MTTTHKHTIEVLAEDQEILERVVESNTVDSLRRRLLSITEPSWQSSSTSKTVWRRWSFRVFRRCAKTHRSVSPLKRLKLERQRWCGSAGARWLERDSGCAPSGSAI